jgi:DNA repair exonuclease SbcCD ATPase subunit
MKIIELHAENLKRLTAVQIRPDGNLVQITGRNGQGKTSVLDAIWWALDGTKNVQTTPIRKGEERAIIRLDLGELKITRKFIAQEDGSYTTSIAVENGDGAKFSSPQSMLDKLLGELTFDPLAFTRMKDAEQVLSLRSLVPGFDFIRAEEDIKTFYARRTEYNRDANTARSSAEELTKDLPKDIPIRVDVQGLSDSLEKAQGNNADVDATDRERAEVTTALEKIDADIKALEAQIKMRKIQKDDAEEILSAIKTQSKVKIDTKDIMDKIRGASEVNDMVNRAIRRDQQGQEAQRAIENATHMTANIDKIKKDAQAAIASAKMPIDGLSIQDGAVYLDGVPFNQASDAQQLQASIGIAMALNPTLKVIRVRDGSLLDQDALKTLSEMADAHDYQIWIERVDSDGTVGFVLEDGHVKGQQLEPASTSKKEQVEQPETKKPAPTGSMFENDRA